MSRWVTFKNIVDFKDKIAARRTRISGPYHGKAAELYRLGRVDNDRVACADFRRQFIADHRERVSAARTRLSWRGPAPIYLAVRTRSVFNNKKKSRYPRRRKP